MLKPLEPPTRGFFAWFNRFFGSVTHHYTSGVSWMIRRAIVGVVLFLGMVAITTWLWRTTPGSLVPDEDQGFYISAVILPDGATLERTDKVVKQVEQAIQSNPANRDVISFTGFDFLGGGMRNNAATIFVTQIPWDERKVTAQQLVGELFGKTARIKEALVLAFNPPPIFGLGTAGGYEFYIQNRGEGGSKRLNEVTQAFLQRVSTDPQLGFAQTLWRANVPQLYVSVDREKAKKVGVPITDVFNALSATLGNYYVNDFNKFGRAWQVLMSADPSYRNRPDDIGAIYVRSDRGDMVPLNSRGKRAVQLGPRLARSLQQPAGGEDLRRRRARHQLGPGHRARRADREGSAAARTSATTGAARPIRRSDRAARRRSRSALAVVMVFLILAAQYEKWSLPLSVLMALPFGTFGALAAIHLRGLTNDVYFQIGLVTLLGLAAKNAILIVEFAVLKQHEGMSASAAAIEAARLRFRPILMTSLAFIFGVLPLAISTGAGAGARHSTGTGVMGGMIAATFLAIFFVPLFFRIITDRRLHERGRRSSCITEIDHHKTLTTSPRASDARPPAARRGAGDGDRS